MLENDEKERVKDRKRLHETDGDIVAITGKMPVGTLTIKYKPRADNHQSSIISTDTVDSSVFEDGE